jgi:hypothetical protein
MNGPVQMKGKYQFILGALTDADVAINARFAEEYETGFEAFKKSNATSNATLPRANPAIQSSSRDHEWEDQNYTWSHSATCTTGPNGPVVLRQPRAAPTKSLEGLEADTIAAEPVSAYRGHFPSSPYSSSGGDSPSRRFHAFARRSASTREIVANAPPAWRGKLPSASFTSPKVPTPP